MHKETRRPVFDPLLLLLKSRRVLIALISLIIGMVVMLFPVLQPVHTELLVLILTLALALISGLSIEDAVIAARQHPVNEDMRQLLQAAADAIIDEMLDVDETWWDSDTERLPDDLKKVQSGMK